LTWWSTLVNTSGEWCNVLLVLSLQAVLSDREAKLAAAEEAARAATAAARDRAAAAQSAQQEVERAVAAQRQQLEQVGRLAQPLAVGSSTSTRYLLARQALVAGPFPSQLGGRICM
jgi:hypothetical protein